MYFILIIKSFKILNLNLISLGVKFLKYRNNLTYIFFKEFKNLINSLMQPEFKKQLFFLINIFVFSYVFKNKKSLINFFNINKKNLYLFFFKFFFKNLKLLFTKILFYDHIKSISY